MENCAYIYNDNLYVTDDMGNIAFIDCEIQYTKDAGSIRKEHPEYKKATTPDEKRKGVDAGHFGISLGQHPSIAVAQNKVMNRYGIWRSFERKWSSLSINENSINIKMVFTDNDDSGTFSSFWCLEETINGDEVNDYVLTNDDMQ